MVSVEAPARPQSLGTCPSEQQHGTLCQAVFSTLLSHSPPSFAHFSLVSMEIKPLNCHLPHLLLQQRIVLKSAFGLCQSLGEGSARSRVCAFPSAATVRTKLAPPRQCITRPTGRHADGECLREAESSTDARGLTRHWQASSEL